MAYIESPMVTEVRLSEVVSALSYALELVEGQAEGHAVRTCFIGMRIAHDLRLRPRLRSALFYALLLKDLGGSSNASKICYLFGTDDRSVKKDLKTTHWTKLSEKIRYVLRNVAPGASYFTRLLRALRVFNDGDRLARKLVEMRCDRSAMISRKLLMPDETSIALRCLDEHWNGQGHPEGLRGHDIPLLSRILGLAQTVEVFLTRDGVDAALDVALHRAGSWFDPELVKILAKTRHDSAFWETVRDPDLFKRVITLEPQDHVALVTDEHLDRIAVGFGQVIDAKSPWTFRHSEAVAEISVGIARTLGLLESDVRHLRRAALLHDVGKLGISNLILDKPGKLNPHEMAQVRQHPAFTYQILNRVRGFGNIAHLAAAHHERLDGHGYHEGRSASAISLPVRILTVADMYEALAAQRPYRQDLSEGQVTEILTRQLGTGIDPEVFAALQCFLNTSNYEPIRLAA